ncbi:hypothetical protein FJ656_31140, partial [Schumannella luteola]
MTSFPAISGLPEVELQAMRLDGESYRLGLIEIPIGIRTTPHARAAAVLSGRSPRLVAALETAAWIWGAAARPPRDAFLVGLAARWRPVAGAGIDVIESVIRPGDVVPLGPHAVTSPLRTALDLVRFRAGSPALDPPLLRALASRGGFTADDAVRALDRGRNLSGKRAAA